MISFSSVFRSISLELMMCICIAFNYEIGIKYRIHVLGSGILKCTNSQKSLLSPNSVPVTEDSFCSTDKS